MNTSGEVADLMAKETIQITETAVKLAGLGAKNLAALLIAVMQDKQFSQGKTNISKLIKEGKELCILQIDREKLTQFNKESKSYGVLYSPVIDKTTEGKTVDIIAKKEDIGRLTYIMEKLGVPTPQKDEKEDNRTSFQKYKQEQRKEDPEKNSPARATRNQSESKSATHGHGSDKMSVHEQIEKYKEFGKKLVGINIDDISR